MEPSIPPEVAAFLGYYVYLYIDPRSEKPFYVGKGQGERILAHLGASGESRKDSVLQELEQAQLEPRLEVLAHGLDTEETALRIEAAAIDLLGLDYLTNEVRGWRSIQLGRIPLEELIALYAADPVSIEDPVLLIRINRLYRYDMSDRALYEATRGIWKLGTRREKAQYAFAVFEGVVREVYEIREWYPAGTLEYETRDEELSDKRHERWEFEGEVAPKAIRDKYLNRSVADYLPRGSQNPVRYVNC